MELLEESRSPALELPQGGEPVMFSPCTAPPFSSPPLPLPSGSPVCWQLKMPLAQLQLLHCYWNSWQLGSAFEVGEKKQCSQLHQWGHRVKY